MRERSTDGFAKGCAGMKDAHPKETTVCEFCFLQNGVFLYLACSYQFQECLVLFVAGSLQLLQEQKVLRYSVMPCFLIAANAYILNFRVTLFSSEVSREYLLHLGHPLEGVVIMF